MRTKIVTLIALLAVLASCSRVPISGRMRLDLVSDQDVIDSSVEEYHAFMAQAQRSRNRRHSERVTRVGRRIAQATEQFLQENGYANQIGNFDWEFSLVKDNEVNAFCMPGGKIVVFEGMMQHIASDDELAVVLGHEVAHAVARHSNERLSQQMVAQLGGMAVNLLFSGSGDGAQAVAGTVYGMGAHLGVMLPYSRKHETEADVMGLALMTIAGYNPDVAVAFWQKMSEANTQQVPTLLSDHPSDAKRIATIEQELPKIKRQYAS